MTVTTEQLTPVIAKWKGWPRCDYSAPFDDEYPSEGLFALGLDIQRDPRDDTDAALELLHWVLTRGPNAGSLNSNRKGGWQAKYAEHMPVTGQPFRDEVCKLAVEVMGEENEDE